MSFFKKLFGGFKKPKKNEAEESGSALSVKEEPAENEEADTELTAVPLTNDIEPLASDETEATEATVSPVEKKRSAAVGKFEVKKTKDDRYVFNLYAANGVIVTTSQIYSSSASALNGIKSIIANAGTAEIEDQTQKEYTPLSYPKWEVYKDKSGSFRFRLNAKNGSCICHSQGYTTKSSCMNGINSIRRTAPTATVDKAYLKSADRK